MTWLSTARSIPRYFRDISPPQQRGLYSYRFPETQSGCTGTPQLDTTSKPYVPKQTWAVTPSWHISGMRRYHNLTADQPCAAPNRTAFQIRLGKMKAEAMKTKMNIAEQSAVCVQQIKADVELQVNPWRSHLFCTSQKPPPPLSTVHSPSGKGCVVSAQMTKISNK